MPPSFATTVHFPNLLIPETSGDFFGLLALIVALWVAGWQWWTHHCSRRDEHRAKQVDIAAEKAARQAARDEFERFRPECENVVAEVVDARLSQLLDPIFERLKRSESGQKSVEYQIDSQRNAITELWRSQREFQDTQHIVSIILDELEESPHNKERLPRTISRWRSRH